MSKITGVHHIALSPAKENYDKTVGFYTDVLGFSQVRSWGDGENRCIMLSCGDNTVMEIMNKGESDSASDGAFLHIAFQVDEVEELLEKVRVAGYPVTTEPVSVTIASTPPYPVRIAFFRGPANEHIELFKVC